MSEKHHKGTEGKELFKKRACKACNGKHQTALLGQSSKKTQPDDHLTIAESNY